MSPSGGAAARHAAPVFAALGDNTRLRLVRRRRLLVVAGRRLLLVARRRLLLVPGRWLLLLIVPGRRLLLVSGRWRLVARRRRVRIRGRRLRDGEGLEGGCAEGDQGGQSERSHVGLLFWRAIIESQLRRRGALISFAA